MRVFLQLGEKLLQIEVKLFQIAHELWLHAVKEIQTKGYLLTSILPCEKLQVEKLSYTVKFQ